MVTHDWRFKRHKFGLLNRIFFKRSVIIVCSLQALQKSLFKPTNFSLSGPPKPQLTMQ